MLVSKSCSRIFKHKYSYHVVTSHSAVISSLMCKIILRKVVFAYFTHYIFKPKLLGERKYVNSGVHKVIGNYQVQLTFDYSVSYTTLHIFQFHLVPNVGFIQLLERQLTYGMELYDNMCISLKKHILFRNSCGLSFPSYFSACFAKFPFVFQNMQSYFVSFICCPLLCMSL